MEIEIDLNKSVEENAGDYFNLAKKAKKKLEGARKALRESREKLKQLREGESRLIEEEKKKEEEKEEREERQRRKEWYEKFHWFISSEGFLCIGGRDATSNEIIVKKHAEKGDLVFHTDMAGSPFFVVKKGEEAGAETLNEAAIATAVYSKAWKVGHTTADVFYVKPEQVSKEAQAGEYMAKGSFMIRGKTAYLHPKMEYAIGLVEQKDDQGRTIDKQVIGGPLSAVKIKTENYVIIVQGKEKKSSLAKKIRNKLKGGELDEIIRFLPAGEGEMRK